ncbi:unnamed protein product, partial [Prorocentrum cordatum]
DCEDGLDAAVCLLQHLGSEPPASGKLPAATSVPAPSLHTSPEQPGESTRSNSSDVLALFSTLRQKARSADSAGIPWIVPVVALILPVLAFSAVLLGGAFGSPGQAFGEL